MILNLPSKKDYNALALDCLFLSFHSIFEVESYIQQSKKIYEDRSISAEEIFEFNSIKLRTSIILLYQAIEYFLKSEICSVSPLLLIDKKREDWPTLPNSNNKDFDSLHTISGDALLSTFFAVTKRQFEYLFVSEIEEVRLLRNKVVHGTKKVDTPEIIVEKILVFYNYFIGDKIWHKQFTFKKCNDPVFGFFNIVDTQIQFAEYLNFVERLLGKSKMKSFIKYDTTARRYLCLDCKSEFSSAEIDLNSYWCVLTPNTPKSRTVTCISCETESKVKRQSCKFQTCKGNVIGFDLYSDKKLCLTCGKIQ